MKGTLTEPLIFSEEAAPSKDEASTHASSQNGHGGHHSLPSKDYEVSEY